MRRTIAALVAAILLGVLMGFALALIGHPTLSDFDRRIDKLEQKCMEER